MKKYFISDIHGNYKEMMALLNNAKVNFKHDLLIVGGDMIDRGKHSGRVIKKIKELQKKYPQNIIVLCGNHEEMAIWHIEGKTDMWFRYGGTEAKKSFKRTFDEIEMKEYFEWLKKLPLIYIDEEYIFSHAGIEIEEKIENQKRSCLWLEYNDFYSVDKETLEYYTNGKKVIHGHTPKNKVTNDGIRVSCDLGASVFENGKLALVNLTDDIYYEYDFMTKEINTKNIKKHLK